MSLPKLAVRPGTEKDVAAINAIYTIAHFTDQGRKFGRCWDVAWYEKGFGSDFGS
jgi:hypothetical protein